MGDDIGYINELRQRIGALKVQLACCGTIDSVPDRELTIKNLQTEISYIERLIQRKTEFLGFVD